MASEYRAEFVAEAMWLCIKGDDFMSAPIYDTQEEAEDAARRMNGELRFFGDGRPANAAARALAGGA